MKSSFRRPAFADARQPDGARNPEPAFEHVALGAARRAVVGHCAAVPAVVRGEYDECVFKLSTLAQRLHHAPHVVVHVFDQGDELGAFLRQRGVPFGNPFEPFRGRLQRSVRGVESQVEEERGVVGGLPGDVFRAPRREEVRRMPFGVDLPVVQEHVVVPFAPVGVVVVHHVAQEALEMVESPLVGQVGAFESQMPFADEGGLVAGALEHLRHGHGRRRKVAPALPGLCPDHARHTHHGGEASRHQAAREGEETLEFA